jgi:hypothetical protein
MSYCHQHQVCASCGSCVGVKFSFLNFVSQRGAETRFENRSRHKPNTLAAIMQRQTVNILTGLLSLGLLTTLIIKLTTVPGGLILSGLFLGGMVIVLILVSCLVVTYLLRLIFKNKSFLTIYFLTTILCFAVFHYKLYSPTLTIVVPSDYSGEVALILSNVTDNILKLDSNGIGYINEWTFEKTYTRPIVIDENGNSLDSLLVGYNPTSFWALGKTCCIDNEEIHYKSFKIKDIKTETEFKTHILSKLVDKKLTKTMKPDKYTIIQTEATKENK